MRLPAARYDRKVEFLRATVTRNALGQEAAAFAAFAGSAAWAQVRWGSASERREVAAQGAAQSATFRVRSTSAALTVTVQDRVRFDGSDWGIVGRASVGAQGSDLEFTAERIS